MIKFGKTDELVPAIGQGMGEYEWDDSQVEVLRAGIDLGMTFIDSAEEYDNGRSEEIVGKAIQGRRDSVFIASKFSPINSLYDRVIRSCEESLRRLQTDYIDLYQIHWPNPKVPLYETLFAMEKLKSDGKIRYIGTGNQYLSELTYSDIFVRGGISSVQLEYNLFERYVEDDISQFCKQSDINIIAYSPLDKGRIVDGKKARSTIEQVANKYGKTIGQVALRWLISKDNVIAIPKAKNLRHLRQNAESIFPIDIEDLKLIDKNCKKDKILVLPSQIEIAVYGEQLRGVYTSIEEAKENRFGLVPSPLGLSEKLSKTGGMKPIRLVKNTDNSYSLIEGRIRYWAWVLAFGDETPIPAYVRENWDYGS